ncbi:MAG: sigma-70 family RNA polymerase sigma factor, partial [Clostridia bacterium]|nr:sigma-70 family RNA polymerase sigma factor [Clostridia bacterium]
YIGVWNAIPPTRPKSLMAFLCKITRNISLKRVEAMARQKRSQATVVSLDELAEILPDESIEENISNDNLTELISDFLRKEKADVRNVFIRKYYFFDSVGDIAKRYGFTEDKVKSMLYHTRKKLKDHFIKEGVKL